MHHAACKVELQPFKQSVVLTADGFPTKYINTGATMYGGPPAHKSYNHPVPDKRGEDCHERRRDYYTGVAVSASEAVEVVNLPQLG